MTFTATVTPGAATGNVTFKDGSTALSTVALNGSGQAQLSISTLTAGSHNITAAYGGNSTYASSTSAPALVQNVNQATTSIALASSGTTSTYGNPVTFTATVAVTSGAGTPAGNVTFNDGATAIGTVTLNGSGQAKLTTSTLSVGGHPITATFISGSTNFAGSGPSNIVNQTVNQVTTTTTLVSSLNPSGNGQSVTFTATVTPATAGGTVTFYDNGFALSSPISLGLGNKATYSTSSLSVGSHPITATYNGDTNNKFSTSSPVNQTVNSVAPDFGISPISAQTVRHGSSVSFTVTINSINNFMGNVSLSVTGLPSRSSASFNPNPVTGGSGNSTLRITTNSKTPLGNKTLTIKGTSGALAHSVKVNLTVN